MSKTIKIYIKHNDLASFEAIDNDNVLYSLDDGLPTQFLNITSGDETEFEIDVETGKIINWDKEKALKAFEKDDKYCSWCGSIVPIQNRTDKYNEWDCPNCESNENTLDAVLLDEKPIKIGKDGYHDERHINTVHAREMALKQMSIDDIEYTKLFKKEKENIQQYRNKYSGRKLEKESVGVISVIKAEYDSDIFKMYKIMRVSSVLFSNDIFCHFDNENKTIRVNSSDSKKARDVLKTEGAYENNYLRVEGNANDVFYELAWK